MTRVVAQQANLLPASVGIPCGLWLQSKVLDFLFKLLACGLENQWRWFKSFTALHPHGIPRNDSWLLALNRLSSNHCVHLESELVDGRIFLSLLSLFSLSFSLSSLEICLLKEYGGCAQVIGKYYGINCGYKIHEFCYLKGTLKPVPHGYGGDQSINIRTAVQDAFLQ